MKTILFIFSLIVLLLQVLGPAAASGEILTLEQAVNLALRHNRNLLTSRDSLVSSEYSVQMETAAFEVQMRPSASAGVSGSNTDDATRELGLGLKFSKLIPWGTEMAVTPGIQYLDSAYEGTVLVGLTQPLFRGRGADYNMAGVYAAEYNQRSAQRNLYLTRVSTILDTVRSVYEIVNAGAAVAQSRASMQRISAHIAGIKAKAKTGYGDAMDLYRAELEIRDAETFLISARERYTDALDALKILLVLPPEKTFRVDAPLTIERFDVDTGAMADLALKTRMEIVQAKDKVDEARRRRALAAHNIQPQLDLQLAYRRSLFNDADDMDADVGEERWSAALASNTDLFRRTEKLSFLQSRLQVTAAQRELGTLRDQIVSEVKRAYRNLENALQQIGIEQERVDQAEGKLALAKVKYRWGRADNFTFIESEKQLRQARISLIAAKVNYIVSTYRFRAALGTLLENHNA